MKYFVTADVHGFTSILKDTLESNGFEVGNPEHKLIICGDIFDRGEEPCEMLEFLKSLGDQFIFIRGNHEDLFFESLTEIAGLGAIGGTISSYHLTNGTFNTILSLSDNNKLGEAAHFIDEKAINYFEVGDYIFVHGWVPEVAGIVRMDWQQNDGWESARWVNGMDCWKSGAKIEGKTIVCGHWHCGWGHKNLHQIDGDEYTLSENIFKDDGIIALDACTPITKKINLLILND